MSLLGQTGVYDLVSFSDSYEDFLTTMGIPSWVVFIIVRASETLEMEMVDDNSVRSRVITGECKLELETKVHPKVCNHGEGPY